MYFATANLKTWLWAWWQLAQACHLDFAAGAQTWNGGHKF